MKYKICYGSWDELDKYESKSVKHFCEDSGIQDYLSLLAKQMKENDPDGKKAEEISKKYR